jgi:DDE superfamily endonuclease
LKPWRQPQWCIPPAASGEFVWRMEDVLEVYRRPDDPHRPVVGFDETSRQLLDHTRPALPPAAGRAARQDYEYVREGTANVFLSFEPLAGWRQAVATERRTRRDWAQQIRELLDGRYATVQKVVLVLDNLNTHTPGSLYETFGPAEARRLTEKLEIHHTPKHGSGLNMAEIEFSVLARTLPKRIATRHQLHTGLETWSSERNARGSGADWQFRTEDARVRLKRLYPSNEL